MAENVADVNVVQKETNEEAKTKEVNKLHITFNMRVIIMRVLVFQRLSRKSARISCNCFLKLSIYDTIYHWTIFFTRKNELPRHQKS